mgnify:CR=1 FL=1
MVYASRKTTQHYQFRESSNTVEWGDLAWLRVLDNDDLSTFCEDLANELIIDASEDDFTGLDCLIREWRATAGQLEDPLRKRIPAIFRARKSGLHRSPGTSIRSGQWEHMIRSASKEARRETYQCT